MYKPGNTPGSIQNSNTLANKLFQLINDYVKTFDNKLSNSTNQIVSAISTGASTVYTTDAGPVDTDTLRVVLDNSTLVTLNKISNYLEFESWDKIIGNSLIMSYYTGIEAGNPTGNANIKQMVYKRGVTTIVTTTYSYDATDKVISVVAS